MLESAQGNFTTTTGSTSDDISSTEETLIDIQFPDVHVQTAVTDDNDNTELLSTTFDADDTATTQTRQNRELSTAAVAGIVVGGFMILLFTATVVVCICLYFLYFKALFKQKKAQVRPSVETGDVERSSRRYESHIYESITDSTSLPDTTVATGHVTSEASGHMTSEATGHMTSEATQNIIDTRHGPEEIELVRNAAYSQVNTAAVSTRHHDNHDDMNMVDNLAYQSRNT